MPRTIPAEGRTLRLCRRCRGTGARYPNTEPWPAEGGDGEPCPSCDGLGYVRDDD